MPIRRLVLLLTIALAGAGTGGHGPRSVPDGPGASEARSAPALVASDHDDSDAVIRSSGRLLSVGWQVGSSVGAWPRGGRREPGRRAEPTDVPTTAFVSSTLITAVVARVVEIVHRAYARPVARAHSGFVSSPSTAPPPFRFV